MMIARLIKRLTDWLEERRTRRDRIRYGYDL
jgi:uncharacterized protein YjiS (DUF1127 family)